MPADAALLILDMINPFDFRNGRALARAAMQIAPRIAKLKQLTKARGGVCIYVNDNFGQWQSDLRELVVRAELGHAPGVLDCLRPQDDDSFVLKPKHSAFFQTPLPLMLQNANARRLLVAGVSAESCVLVTALDAHMRDYDVHVPVNCIGSAVQSGKNAALIVLRSAGINTAAFGRAKPPR